MIEQEVIKLPPLEDYTTLIGRKICKLPDNGTIIVQGQRKKPYPVKLTRKTHYKWKELVPEWNEGAGYTAVIDTDTEPWTVYSIIKANVVPTRSLEEERKEYMELGGDY